MDVENSGLQPPPQPDTLADGTVSHNSFEQHPSRTLFGQNPSDPQIDPQFQNQPHETREFRCDDSKETLSDSCHQENDKSASAGDGGGFTKVEIQTSLLSDTALTSTHSGTDKYKSGGEKETTSKRKRKSRWGPPLTESTNGETSGSDRDSEDRKRSEDHRVILPYIISELPGGIDLDPETQTLNARLLEISRKLQSGLPLHDRPECARSLSPEPIYDSNGVRINTREGIARQKLTRERKEIISEMIKKNPVFKPPADYSTPKLQKELYIPKKEHPGYNFIGLIIGPRRNTQKMMERGIGTKIVVTGKGLKEGKWLQETKQDPYENEDLNVLVEAETQESLDAASAMLDKLLQPIDEVLNEHKHQHFRKLETLKKIRDEETCRLCGVPGHSQNVCPEKNSIFKSDVLCKICGDGGHPTIDCPAKNTTSKKMDDQYQNFLAELGGTVPNSATKPTGHAPFRNFTGAPPVYGVVPPNQPSSPHAHLDQSQSFSSVPWPSNPNQPAPSPDSSAEQDEIL